MTAVRRDDHGTGGPDARRAAGIASEVTGAGTATIRCLAKMDCRQEERRATGVVDEAGSSYYDGVARGEAGLVSDDYRELTGNEPMSIRDVIDMHRSEMPLVGAVG